MADTTHLAIVTPERKLFEADVDSVQIPGLDGELGLLPNHSPRLTQRQPARLLTYTARGTTGQLFVSEGFAEVMPDQVRGLAEEAERPEDIDVHKAQAAKEKAEIELARASTDPTVDV